MLSSGTTIMIEEGVGCGKCDCNKYGCLIALKFPRPVQLLKLDSDLRTPQRKHYEHPVTATLWFVLWLAWK